MPISYATSIRNDRLNVLIQHAGPAAKVEIFTDSYATLLVELTCSTPIAGLASNGVLTLGNITPASAVGSGEATLARIVTSTGTILVSNLVVSLFGAGGSIQMDNTSISTGQVVSIIQAKIYEGNP